MTSQEVINETGERRLFLHVIMTSHLGFWRARRVRTSVWRHYDVHMFIGQLQTLCRIVRPA